MKKTEEQPTLTLNYLLFRKSGLLTKLIFQILLALLKITKTAARNKCAPTCSALSDKEFLSERLRVTMTEGWWSARPRSWGLEGLGGQPEARAASSLSGDEGSCLRTGTDTGMTSGRRLSSRCRLAFRPSEAAGLHGRWFSYREGESCFETDIK